MHLHRLKLAKILDNMDIESANKKDKVNAMIFIRHHLSEDLKYEYIQLEKPYEIWQNLKDKLITLEV